MVINCKNFVKLLDIFFERNVEEHVSFPDRKFFVYCLHFQNKSYAIKKRRYWYLKIVILKINKSLIFVFIIIVFVRLF